MDWLSFFASVIKSLAWPAVVLVLSVMLRKRIGPALERLFDRATKIKGPGGFEADFERDLIEAREKSEELEIETAAANPPNAQQIAQMLPPTAPDDPYIALAKLSPEAAILEAFKEVERALIENRSAVYGPTTASTLSTTRLNLSQIVRDLNNTGAISSEVLEQFRRVRELRNLAAHPTGNSDLSIAAAVEYRNLCQSLISAFNLGFGKLSVLREPVGQVD